MSDRPPPVIERSKLMEMEKDQVVELLVLALEGQALATRNMAAMNDLMAASDRRIKELESKNQTLESEIIVLRNRPT